MSKKKIILRILAILLIAAGWWVAKLIWFKPFNINHFYERVFIEFVLKHPQLLSQLRILEPYGIDFHNHDLDDISDAFERKMNALIRKDLEILRSYDRSKQTSAQLLSTDILDWFLDDQVRGQEFMYYSYPVNQLYGEQSELPTFMATIHYIGKKRDAENYITRLSKFGIKFDQLLEGLRIREQKRIIPPRFVIQKVLTEMRGFVSQNVRHNILYTSFHEKVAKLTSLSEPEKEALYHAAETEIQNTVYPAYRKLISYFESLEPRATTDDGVWKLPNGDAFYAYVLRSQTTTNMTPEEVHNLGLKEVTRIQDEMRTILDSLGYSGKSIAEALDELNKDPRFLYADTDEGRKECLADYSAIINEIDHGLSSAFDIRPRVGVQVEQVPQFKEKTAPGAYYEEPSLDGARPGVFYANLRNMNEIPKWTMRTLAYHEAIPGHHFQIALQEELKGVPTFRRIIPFTAYAEGWALYAEKLAWEYGFEKDPYSNLGRLRDELFRAVRLVVDTGIHRNRWTREEAIHYMKENTGMPEGEVVAEIERYIVSPGQACAYKIGQLKILELRERAKTQLGARFNIKEFHNVVLQNGAMPLEILERVVDQYISKRKES